MVTFITRKEYVETSKVKDAWESLEEFQFEVSAVLRGRLPSRHQYVINSHRVSPTQEASLSFGVPNFYWNVIM